MPRGLLSLVGFLVLVFVMPLLMADVIVGALARLGLGPRTAMWAAFGIFVGGLVNVPVYRLKRQDPRPAPPHWFHAMLGSHRWVPARSIQPRRPVIAVNLGGCLVPLLIVVHEFARLAAIGGTRALYPTFAAVALNVAVCWRLAHPVEKLGIVMPSLVPAGVAAACAVLLVPPEFRAPLAFCAGVLGPLIGADLLHLRDMGRISTGIMSIGGAGTFDGIVVSGLLAIILA